jgi:hypothetical protein
VFVPITAGRRLRELRLDLSEGTPSAGTVTTHQHAIGVGRGPPYLCRMQRFICRWKFRQFVLASLLR